jgi:hypothetical protein
MNIYNCKGGTRSPRMRVRLGPLLESTRLRRALLASSSEISIHLARCLADAKMGLQNTGGVVEWLMAPVLKTGRAQALVGSNPTPSAISSLRCSAFRVQRSAFAVRCSVLGLRRCSIRWKNAEHRTSNLELRRKRSSAFLQKPLRRKKRAHDSKNRGEENIGKIMRADIHPRKRDE